MRFAFFILGFNLRSRDFHHVLGLRAFWAVCHFKFNFLTLYQGLITIAGYRAVMHKNILLAGLFDKSVALCVVKPFDLADSLYHLK